MKKLFYAFLYLSLTVTVGAVVFAPIFRCTWYWDLPVAPGDPYGPGDILELLLYYLKLGGAVSSVVLALGIVAFDQQRRKFGALVVVGSLVLVSAGYYMSQWAWLNCGP